MGRYWRVVALAAIAAGGVELASELRPWHPEAALLQATTLDEFERRLAALREPLTIPGMSAAIARADRVIWSRGFGVADGERTVMADADTLYHLASVTKPYAATVVLQLADEGRLRLSDVAPGVRQTPRSLSASGTCCRTLPWTLHARGSTTMAGVTAF